MLRTFLVVVIFSILVVSNINLYEAKRLNYQSGNVQTCTIKCAPPFCRIECFPTLTTTITPTTATSTTLTSTAMTSTTNTKANYTENQQVIISFFEMKLHTLLLQQFSFPQQEESKYTCLWMSSSHSYGEPKLLCMPKLNLLDVIRMY